MSALKKAEIFNFQFELFSVLTKLTLVTWTFFRPYISSEKAILMLDQPYPKTNFIIIYEVKISSIKAWVLDGWINGNSEADLIRRVERRNKDCFQQSKIFTNSVEYLKPS